MKYLVLALLLLVSHGMLAQGKMHPEADSTVLTDSEAASLNGDFGMKHPGFDFHGKKIAFVTGSTGRSVSTKGAYFSTRRQMGSSTVQQLELLTGEEKKRTGGYDAIIAYYVKIFPGSSRRHIIKQLQKEHQKAYNQLNR